MKLTRADRRDRARKLVVAMLRALYKTDGKVRPELVLRMARAAGARFRREDALLWVLKYNVRLRDYQGNYGADRERRSRRLVINALIALEQAGRPRSVARARRVARAAGAVFRNGSAVSWLGLYRRPTSRSSNNLRQYANVRAAIMGSLPR